MGEAKLSSFLIFAVIRLIIYFGIVVFALLAARRHKLTGLWILAGASIIGFIQNVINVMLSSPFRHESIIKYADLLACLSYITMVAVLIGWCALAFSTKK